MADLAALEGRYLGMKYNGYVSQLQSQVQYDQSTTFPNIVGHGCRKDVVNKKRNIDYQHNDVIAARSVDKSTKLATTVASHSLNVKNTKVTKESYSGDTLLVLESQGNYRKAKTRNVNECDSESGLRFPIRVNAKRKIAAGLPTNKKGRSLPKNSVNGNPLWEVQNSRVLEQEKKVELRDDSLEQKRVIQRSNRQCTCGLTEPKYCMLHLMEVVQNIQRPHFKRVSWVPMSMCTTYVATTTPTHPYSSADLIGPYTESHHSARLASSDDVRLSSGSARQDTINQRNYNKHTLYKDSGTGPQSANSLIHPSSGRKDRKNLLISSREKGLTEQERDNRDRHKDDNLPSPHRNNYFKPTGARQTNFLGGQQISPSQRQQGSAPTSNREQDESLMAMGTNWTPPSIPNISSAGSSVTRSTSYSRPGSQGTLNGSIGSNHSNSNGGYISLAVSQAPMISAPRRKTTMPQISGSRSHLKEGEPRYPDPFSGSSLAFQQRLADLSSLESETIRWERTRKFKKKTKPDSSAKET